MSQNQRTCDGERKDQVLKKEAMPYLEGVGWASAAVASGGRAQVGGSKMGEQGIFLMKKLLSQIAEGFSFFSTDATTH